MSILKTGKFDIIIAGAGLSGLSLAWHLAEGGYKGEIALVDSSFAPLNDKTWCFWTRHSPPFKEIVYRKWNALYVDVLEYEKRLPLNSYSYYAIRSGDFKEYVLRRIKDLPNFHLIEEGILDLFHQRKKAVLTTKQGDSFIADYIFQSVFAPNKLDRTQIHYSLVQHFVGWEIQTNQKIFDPETPVFMDFDENWPDGVAFMYILPFSESKALFEYTIFSSQPEDEETYEEKILEYIRENYSLNENEYVVLRKEFGQIPMEDRPYFPWYDQHIMNLGTSAGIPKPSTGYAFMRIQKHIQALAESLIANKEPVLPYRSPKQFQIYDRLLLHVLSSSSEDSLSVFRDLFMKNPIERVLCFLDEETDLLENLMVMNSVPYLPFIKAILANLKSTKTK